jgi:hypothetical protein
MEPKGFARFAGEARDLATLRIAGCVMTASDRIC